MPSINFEPFHVDTGRVWSPGQIRTVDWGVDQIKLYRDFIEAMKKEKEAEEMDMSKFWRQNKARIL